MIVGAGGLVATCGCGPQPASIEAPPANRTYAQGEMSAGIVVLLTLATGDRVYPPDRENSARALEPCGPASGTSPRIHSSPPTTSPPMRVNRAMNNRGLMSCETNR